MIEHISLRCRDARASRKFYEQALAPLGYEVDKEYGDAFGFIQGGRHDFWVTKGKVGTPNHLAFHANDEAVIWDEELKRKKPTRRSARPRRRGSRSARARPS